MYLRIKFLNIELGRKRPLENSTNSKLIIFQKENSSKASGFLFVFVIVPRFISTSPKCFENDLRISFEEKQPWSILSEIVAKIVYFKVKLKQYSVL